jgi:hypothetical protein
MVVFYTNPFVDLIALTLVVERDVKILVSRADESLEFKRSDKQVFVDVLCFQFLMVRIQDFHKIILIFGYSECGHKKMVIDSTFSP